MDTNLSYEIKKLSPQLLVSDLDSSIIFYTKQLDFEIDFVYEKFYCGISKNGFSIHLKQAKPNFEERISRRESEHNDLIFSIQAIESLYEDILKRNVNIIQSLRNMPYGKEFYIIDPDGYILSFIEEK